MMFIPINTNYSHVNISKVIQPNNSSGICEDLLIVRECINTLTASLIKDGWSAEGYRIPVDGMIHYVGDNVTVDVIFCTFSINPELIKRIKSYLCDQRISPINIELFIYNRLGVTINQLMSTLVRRLAKDIFEEMTNILEI